MDIDSVAPYANAFLCSELTQKGIEMASAIILREYIWIYQNRMQARVAFSPLRRKRLSNYLQLMLKKNWRCPTVREIDLHWEIYFRLKPESEDIGRHFIEDEVINDMVLVIPPEEYRNLPDIKPGPLREKRMQDTRRLEDFGRILRFHCHPLMIYDFNQILRGFIRPEEVPRFSTDISDFLPALVPYFSEKLPPVPQPTRLPVPPQLKKLPPAKERENEDSEANKQ